MQPIRTVNLARPPVSRLAVSRISARRLAGIALVGALVAVRPAAAQSAAPAKAPVTNEHATLAPPAPALTVLGGIGTGSMGLSARLVGRYTFWVNPTWGVAPEIFTGEQGMFVGSLRVTGADVAGAWRLPTRVADLVLHLGVGAASYARYQGDGVLPTPGYVAPPPLTGVAFTSAAEASAVFHPWRALGLLLGARAEMVAPGHGLGPYWNGELVVGLSLTHAAPTAG
jgi:hypothetical protein